MKAPVARAVVFVWALSLVLFPRTGDGVRVDVLAALAWACVLVAGVAESRTTRLIASGCAAAVVCAVWTTEASAYPKIAAFTCAFAGIGALLRLDRRALLTFVGVAAIPALLALLVWTIGDDRAHETLRGEWALPDASFATFTLASRTLAVAAAAWTALGVRLHLPSTTTATRGIVAVACAALVVGDTIRAASIASVVVLPEDAGWSEPAALLNLLRLRLGAPIFAPFAECSSYSYAPTVELLHHVLLAPFGADLSLLANRLLCVGWQVATAAALGVALLPVVRGRVARLLLAAGAFLAATASFHAPHIHPDHLLMPWFALALGLALNAERLSPRVVTAGLVALPVLATAVKLTGAGVGLGLALTFAFPLRRRTFVALAAGAVLSVATLFVYERAEPGFWRYTFALQASHPIEWAKLATIWVEPSFRVFLLAVVAAALASRRGHDDVRGAAREATRVLLVTLGFALPSAMAYLKVGGRENSLVPLAIGALVAIARLIATMTNDGVSRAFAAATGAAVVLAIVPPGEVIPAAVRDAVRARHARMTEHVREETAAGRRVLLPESNAAWLAAGRTDVPWDRWQTINELALGHHPEADICRARVVSGFYDTLIIDFRFVDPLHSPSTAELRPALERNYALVADEPIGGGAVPAVRVYRFRKR